MTKWIYDWPQIIRDLQADAYTEAGTREVREAAGDWVTCACGNLCDAIPRNPDGEPENISLASMGVYFEHAIVDLCAARTVRERSHYAEYARYYLYWINVIAAEILEGKR